MGKSARQDDKIPAREKMTPDPIREPYHGIYYYADPSAKSVTYRRNTYNLRMWRNTIGNANLLAKALQDSGYKTLVRRIAFHKGGCFKDMPGKKVIYCYGIYGVYTRGGKTNG